MAAARNTRTATKTGYPRRGEIYLTALDPTLGREIQKTRPALIIQNDVSNRLSEVTIVAPMTSTVRFPLSPVHVLIAADPMTGLNVISVAVFNQIRAVDRMRMVKRLGAVDRGTLELVDEAIKIGLGLIVL
jgi:mRNA interferase MazF